MDSQQEVQTHVLRLKALSSYSNFKSSPQKEIEILVNRPEIDSNTYSR